MATRLAVPPPLREIDRRLIAWMDRHGVRLLRAAIGLVFVRLVKNLVLLAAAIVIGAKARAP